MKNFFSIGEAAKITDMTSETLRHYDRIGLMKPDKKESGTGYRYYSKDDIVRLNTISALRRMELSLGEIKQILDYNSFEEIVDFLKAAEKKADDKIAKLSYAKSKIIAARADYENKLRGGRPQKDIFLKQIPERVILLSDTMRTPTLNNLWNYHSSFYEQLPEGVKDSFAFEDLAGIYTENGDSRIFAVCLRHAYADELKVLPEGKWLCAYCTEQNRENIIEKLKKTAKERTGSEPHFCVQLVVLTGILQWNYQIQLYLGTAH